MFYGVGIHFGFQVPKETQAAARLRESKKKEKVCYLFNFRGAPMMTTYVRSAGSRTQEVGKFLEKASQTDVGVRLAELENPFIKKYFHLCRKGPDLCSPFILQSVKGAVPHRCWTSVR